MDTRNPQPKEVIGSKDLRESFKESERIRGSWFINGIELHQFEANSPASVVAQINARTSAHFVHAEVDDQGHLVLSDKSGADIKIGLGAAYVDAAPASSGDVAKDVLKNLKHEQEKQSHERRGNRVLEMLGLEETESEETVTEGQTVGATARQGFETGLSAEERAERHRRASGGAPQIASNPTPGSTSGAVGKLDDGRGRTGTGGGSGESTGNAIQR